MAKKKNGTETWILALKKCIMEKTHLKFCYIYNNTKHYTKYAYSVYKWIHFGNMSYMYGKFDHFSISVEMSTTQNSLKQNSPWNLTSPLRFDWFHIAFRPRPLHSRSMYPFTGVTVFYLRLSRFEFAITSVTSLPPTGQSSRSIRVGNACQRARDQRERAVVTRRSARVFRFGLPFLFIIMADATLVCFLIKHHIYNDWTVNLYAFLCKLCMSSVAIFFRENPKVLLLLLE